MKHNRTVFRAAWFLVALSIFMVSCRSYPTPEPELAKRSASIHGMGVVQVTNNDDVDNAYSGGVGGSYHFHRFLTVEVNYTPSLDTRAKEDSESGVPDWETKVKQSVFNSVLKFNLVSDERIRPYLGGGINFMNYSNFDIRDSSITEIDIEDNTGVTGILGVIVDKKDQPWSVFGEAWWVSNRPDVEGRRQNGDKFEQDDFNMNSLFIILGVQMHF